MLEKQWPCWRKIVAAGLGFELSYALVKPSEAYRKLLWLLVDKGIELSVPFPKNSLYFFYKYICS